MNVKGKYRNDDCDDDMDVSSGDRLEYFESEGEDGGRVYTVFLDEGIREPSYYRLIILMLMAATEKDMVVFRVNSPGGVLETGVALVSAIRGSKAHTHASVIGECISAATIIAFACDTIEVAEYSAFMIHTFSGLMGGTANNILASSTYHSKRIERIYRDVFKGFLSEEEFATVLNHGVDLYFTSGEVIDRLKALA